MANATLNTIATARSLRDIVRDMDADKAQAIREAYYKAMDGLRELADTLEAVDAEMGSPCSAALIEEHLIACESMRVMSGSHLGRTL